MEETDESDESDQTDSSHLYNVHGNSTGGRGNMGKKKREHVVFDKMLVLKKKVPITKVNRMVGKSMEKRTVKKSV